MPRQHNITGRKSVLECAMTAETDLYFTKIKLSLKFCLIILYGSGCCGNSDEVTVCSFGIRIIQREIKES
jgi:hypothetical protein